MPYLAEVIPESRFLKRVEGYRISLDNLIRLVKERALSNEDMTHLEKRYLTTNDQRTKERAANDEKFYKAVILEEPADKPLSSFLQESTDQRWRDEKKKTIVEMREKYRDILESAVKIGEKGESDRFTPDEVKEKINAFEDSIDMALDQMYQTLPSHLFLRFYTDKTMVVDHGFSHSLEVLSYMLDILAKDSSHLNMDPAEIKTMVYSAIMHDMSNIVARGAHEKNSTYMIEKMFEILPDRDIDVQKLKDICLGHKKIENDLNVRDEHKTYYLAQLIHDADALSAVLALDRIFNIWKTMTNTVFFKKTMPVKERISLLKANSYLEGDAINDLLRQGFFRRRPELYITKGAKDIISASVRADEVPKYLESKRLELLQIHGRIYRNSDINKMIEDAQKVIKILDVKLPYQSSAFRDRFSAFTTRMSFYTVTQMLKALFKRHNVRFVKNLVISDIHGGYKRLVGLFSILDSTLNEENAIENIETVLNDSDINAVYVLGDIVDRGSWQIKTFNFIANAARSGKVRYVIGNHDLYSFMNMTGLHLPFYPGYKGIDDDYTDKYGNVKAFWQEKLAKEPADTADKLLWAQAVSDYMRRADTRQKEIWDGELARAAQIFTEAYGEKLDMKKGRDVLNNPRALFSQDEELRKWWASVLGHNVGVMVYTGLRAADKMSLNWWNDRLAELEALVSRPEYSDTRFQKAFEAMYDIIVRVITEHEDYLDEEVAKGNLKVRVVDALMYGNYRTTEWSILDWSYHKDWGSENGGLIAQRNAEIEEDFRSQRLIAKDAELTKEQQELLDSLKINNVSYLQDEKMLSIRDFFRDNFFLVRRDEYGTYFMHSMLPRDKDGDVAMGRVENGRIVTHDENGKRIKGMYYKGKHYVKDTLIDGLEIIAHDIRNFNPEVDYMADIQEALTLITSIYADLTTAIKPQDIQQQLKNTKLERLMQGTAGRMMRLGVGHNPRSQSAQKGLHPVEFSSGRQRRMILAMDNDLSDKYAPPLGKGSMQLHSGDLGIVDHAYNSGDEDAYIIANTLVSRNQFLLSVLYDICFPVMIAADHIVDFFNGGIRAPIQRLITSLSIRRHGVRESNSVVLYPVPSKRRNNDVYPDMALARGKDVNMIAVCLNSYENDAFSRQVIASRQLIPVEADGKVLRVPVSFMYAQTSHGNYIEVYVGSAAKEDIKKATDIPIEELYDTILGSATAFLIKSLREKNNPFEKHIKVLNSRKALILNMTKSSQITDALSSDDRHIFDSVMTMSAEHNHAIDQYPQSMRLEYFNKLNTIFGHVKVESPSFIPVISNDIIREKVTDKNSNDAVYGMLSAA